jgi:predicted alpha/beta-fold hydrolase
MLQNTGISIFKVNVRVFMDLNLFSFGCQFLTSFSLDAVDSHLIHLNGYDSLYDYRYKTSPAPTAWNIATPTLSISAEDDPVCDVRGCPCHCTKKMEQYQQCLSQHGKHIGGPGLIVVKTAAGGHLGFPNIGGSSTWTDNVILDWFNHFAD